MKIEDIKPGDVIVRTEDGMVNKVAEVTPDGLILRLAYTDMEKCFHVFLKPDGSKLTAEHYEPATDEQRQYMDSKLADFYGTNTEAANKRITALASMMGDLKQENNELAERVKQLMDDYNRVVKRIDSSRTLSDLVEALDKLEELSKQLNTANSNCKEAEEKFAKLLEDYYTLKDFNEIAESRVARFEHSDIVSVVYECKYQLGVKVGSSACLGCEHCLIPSDTGTESILCAYNYDKEKEKQQRIDNLQRRMNQSLNS